jgi:TetR/AcrR family transcriptional repressor of nem operon
MARTRGFDEDEVLDRAMALFWRKGFEATSIEELVGVSRINRASMYAAFGDKRRLFLAVLDHYLTRVNAERLAILSQGESATAAIAGFFGAIIAAATGPERHLGCLITNTLTEVAPTDPEIAAKLQSSLQRIETAFAETIRRGQDMGEIAPGKDARFFVGTAQGLRVLARSGTAEPTLRDIVATALTTLG